MRRAGQWLAVLAAAACAYGPDAESVLDRLLDGMGVGMIGEDAYGAFLDALDAEGGDDGGCAAWRDAPEMREAAERYPEIADALRAACPDWKDAFTEDSSGDGADSISAGDRSADAQGRSSARGPLRTGLPRERGLPRSAPDGTRLFASEDAHPRRDDLPAPYLRGDGKSSLGKDGFTDWTLSLRDGASYLRRLRLGSSALSMEAGHIDPDLESGRLGFIAGRRFYAGWSGASGIGGPLYSPYPALDGLGIGAEAGAWTAEAAATWNRLDGGNTAVTLRRDASLWLFGLERRGRIRAEDLLDRIGFKAQAAREHFEAADGSEWDTHAAGAEIDGPAGPGCRWRVGGGASLMPSPASGPGRSGRAWRLGSYGEAEFRAARRDRSLFDLFVHQADADWANPLQAPRGNLQDTLPGGWVLSGRGEGGLSARSRFPIFSVASYRADALAGTSAAWSLREDAFLTGEGRAALSQCWERDGLWAAETGFSVRHRRAGLASAGEVPHGWGQSLDWRGGAWEARAALMQRLDDGYGGSRPAPATLSLAYATGGADAGRTDGVSGGSAAAARAYAGGTTWSAEMLTGDIRKPGRYLRAGFRETWNAGRRFRFGHALYVPWTPAGAGDMGYQLRMDAEL